MMTRFPVRAAVAAGLLIIASNTLAQPVGRVLMAVGDVVANRGGRAVPLGTGIAVESGDQIRTGAASSAQIRFDDGSVIALKPQTVFGIDEFAYAGRSDGTERAIFNLIAGGMRTVTGLIGKVNQRNYAIKTPTATVGIRGSGFNLAACTPAVPCQRADGSRARDGTYGQVFDLRIFSQNNAGTQDWQRGDVFLIPDVNAPGERLAEVPAFLAHTLVERSRNAGRSGSTAGEGTAATSSQASAGDGRATQTPLPPAPLTFVSTETRSSTGSVGVLATSSVTGFIALYNRGTSAFDVVGNCGTPPCASSDATSFLFSGNQLNSYSSTQGPMTVNASGATVSGLQTLDLGSSMIGIYQLTGPISGTTVAGSPFSNPAAFLVGFTNDAFVGGGAALPSSGSFSFGGAGNSIGILVDAAGNSGTLTLSGSYNATSRLVSMSATGTIASVGTYGSATLSFGGSGTIPAGKTDIQAAAISYSCSGGGCQSSSGSGNADLGFIHDSSRIKAMVVNGGLYNATRPGNVTLFIGAGKCVSGAC